MCILSIWSMSYICKRWHCPGIFLMYFSLTVLLSDGRKLLPTKSLAPFSLLFFSVQMSTEKKQEKRKRKKNLRHRLYPVGLTGGWILGWKKVFFFFQKFFIRASKQEKQKFVCLRQGMCKITKESRVQCQHCRYQKCLQLHMYYPGTPCQCGPHGSVMKFCEMLAQLSETVCLKHSTTDSLSRPPLRLISSVTISKLSCSQLCLFPIRHVWECVCVVSVIVKCPLLYLVW